MIICFSGTGNSLYVAKTLSEHLGDKQLIHLKGDILIDPSACSLSAASERIIWVFPTYSWGVPPVLVRFIREVRINHGPEHKHYMVATCGDDIGDMTSQWRKLISKRGWTAADAYSIIMPNTYVLMKGFDVDNQELTLHKLAQAPDAIATVADKIASGVSGDIVTKGSWPWLKSHIIYPYFKRFCMSPKPFRSNGRCIACGKCAKACPLNNINMSENRPQWHDNCALCLRCYHICPVDAVTYGNATKGKGQYFNQ